MGEAELSQPPAQPSEKKGFLGRVQQGVEAAKHVQAERSEKKTAAAQAQADAMWAQRQALLDQGHELYEYRVVAIKSSLIGDKMDVGQVEATLNQWAAQGWHVRSITETEVAGHIGPGGTAGLVIVFERRLTQA